MSASAGNAYSNAKNVDTVEVEEFMKYKENGLFLKKTLSFALLCALLFGCSPSKTLKDGSYESTVQGYASSVKVQTVFESGKIAKIKVLEHNESPDIGQIAIDTIPNDIVKHQSLQVDGVTGATSSSNAIKKAVEDAIVQAGGSIAGFNKEIAKSSEETLIKSADVIVIGGGGAGLSAAVSASENGASVILIEKTALLGGNTIRAGGPFNAVDPEKQQNLPAASDSAMEAVKKLTGQEPKSELHKKWMEQLKADLKAYEEGNKTHLFDSVALHILQTYSGGDFQGDLAFIEKLATSSLETSKWLTQNGVLWKDEITTVPGGLWPRAHIPINAAGRDYIVANKKKAMELGVEILLNCEAKELILDSQPEMSTEKEKSVKRVTGVKAVLSSGRKVELIANKAVILATGGFAANEEMRHQYDPTLLMSLKTTNSPAITGDGIKMADAIGASLVNMGYIQCLPLGNPKTGSLNGWMGGIGVEYYYQINQDGKRFMAEDSRRDTMTKALLEQKDAMSFIITDTNIESKDSKTNLWGDDIEKLVSEGAIYRAQSIEELAKQIGVDPAVLKQTHETFNSYVETGKDSEFGRSLFGEKIDTPPFYASPRTPTVHHTMGGIEIDLKTRVLDKDGEIIKGLYAAGEVTGTIHGKNRLGGNALVDIHVFGREAGKNAALEE